MKKTIIAAAALVAMTACNKSIIEVAPVQEYGTISLGVTADTEMVVTKADEQTQPALDLTGYNVTLAGESVNWTKQYEEIEPTDWKVPAGSYTIYVENKTAAEIYTTHDVKGEVRVSGETTVTVTAGLTSECTVACTPQNSKVSFISTEDFNTVFDLPSVTVTNANSTRNVAMTVGATHAEENAAYFEVETLTWTLTAKLGEENKTYSKQFTPVKDKWTQITFTTGTTDGQIEVTITVDGEITETETITAVVDPFSQDVELNPQPEVSEGEGE